MWSRIYLIPLLQAEEDRDLVRRTMASAKMEKELMGGETKVYNSDRYVQSDAGMIIMLIDGAGLCGQLLRLRLLQRRIEGGREVGRARVSLETLRRCGKQMLLRTRSVRRRWESKIRPSDWSQRSGPYETRSHARIGGPPLTK